MTAWFSTTRLYIISHLTSKLLSIHNTSNDTQVIPFELDLRQERWMFMCLYRPPKQNNPYFLENLSSIPDHYSSIYDNCIFLGNLIWNQAALHWHHLRNHLTSFT